jgi:hypothetical protein
MFDFVLKNAEIITLDPALPRCRWLAGKDGKIAALGSRDDFAGEAKLCMDLKGAAVIPGLGDCHVHGMSVGRNLLAVDLQGLTSLDEVLHRLEARAKITPPGKLVHGYGLKHEALREKRMPTRKELDAVCPNHPCLVFHTSCHGMAVNSITLKQSGLLEQPDLMAGCTEELENGLIFQDQANFTVQRAVFGQTDGETLKEFFLQFAAHAASRGCTTVHSLDGGYTEGAFLTGELLQESARDACIHALNMWQVWDVAQAKRAGLPRVGGCMCLDGARALFTAAYSRPFRNRPDTRGLLYESDLKIYNYVYEAHKNNMQVGLHAMGDRAIDQIIYIIDSVTKQLGDRGLRHRIEHFSYPAPDHIEMAAELQLALPMQPIWCDIWDNPENSVFAPMLGEEAAENNEPFAKLVKAGCMVGSGSDSPVTPIDPIKALHILVNNPRPARRVSVTEALKICTSNIAWIGHEEQERGTLEAGKYADLVVLDRSPYSRPEEIDRSQILLTMSEGKVVYHKLEE